MLVFLRRRKGRGRGSKNKNDNNNDNGSNLWQQNQHSVVLLEDQEEGFEEDFDYNHIVTEYPATLQTVAYNYHNSNNKWMNSAASIKSYHSFAFILMTRLLNFY